MSEKQLSSSSPATPDRPWLKQWWPPFLNLRQHKDFTVFWGGNLVSAIGDEIYLLALMWYVLQSTGSVLQTGIVPAFSFIAQLTVGLVAGVFVDRWPRKKILILSDVTRGLIVLMAGLLAMWGVLPLWYIYFAAFALTAVSMFFNPAAGAMLPEVIGGEYLLRANAFMSATRRIVDITGRGVGGAIVAIISAAGAMILNAISFAVSALCIACIRVPEIDYDSKTRLNVKNFFLEVKEGITFVYSNSMLSWLFVVGFFGNFGGGLTMGLTAVLVQQQLQADVSILGVVVGATAIGGLLGSSIVASWGQRLSLQQGIIGSAFVTGVTQILVGWTWWWPLTVALFAISGFALAIGNAPIQTILQLQTPPKLRGRVFTAFIVLLNLGSPAAIVVGAVLADRFGLPLTYSVAGIILVLIGVWAWYRSLSQGIS